MTSDELQEITKNWTPSMFTTFILNERQLASAIQHAGGDVGRVLDQMLDVMCTLAANHISITATHDHTKTHP